MRHKAIHFKFEKVIKLTFLNQSLVCIPVWIEQIKPLILGFGIFEKVHSRPLKMDSHLQWVLTHNGQLVVDLAPFSRAGAEEDQTIDFRFWNF